VQISTIEEKRIEREGWIGERIKNSTRKKEQRKEKGKEERKLTFTFI
jgi:hypothetical protein